MTTRVSVPKLNGFDIELGNYVDGLDLPGGTGREASLALWQQFDGVCASTRWASSYSQQSWHSSYGAQDNPGWGDGDWSGGYDNYGNYEKAEPPAHSTDWGRKWLPSNGACCYIDLNHLEICGAEVLSARDHVAMRHAMLLRARQARALANASLPKGRRIEVLANNSDGMGNSYGGHIDLLVSRRCYENVLQRKVHLLSFLAAHQASSMLYAGQGKVGSENGHGDVSYQFSQRADFIEQLLAPQTTYRRPLVNTRDESLCGSWRSHDPEDTPEADFARLHIISYDTTLCHLATFLAVGTLQIVLCMLEQEDADTSLILDDPVDAVSRWSHGDLKTTVRLASGDSYTALEVQEAILERAAAFVSDGHAEGLVPEADLIIRHWADALRLLRQNDIHALARRCDWALKLIALDRAMTKHQKDWTSPEIKMLDHMYSSIDINDGLYWQYEQNGFVERIVSDADVERAAAEPPDNTRAWLRAHLLRKADPDELDAIDWDSIRFRPRESRRYACRTAHMSNPLRFTRDECEQACESAQSLSELLDVLGVEADDKYVVDGSGVPPKATVYGATTWNAPRSPLLLSAHCAVEGFANEPARTPSQVGHASSKRRPSLGFGDRGPTELHASPTAAIQEDNEIANTPAKEGASNVRTT